MKSFIKELLSKESLINRENKYYLSFYMPLTEENKDDIKTYIKSKLLKALRKNEDLSDMTKLHERILDKVFLVLSKGKSLDISNGLGIFIEFNAYKQEKGRMDEIKDSNLHIVDFSRTPKEEIFIGNIYDIDQLIWMSNVHSEALILSVNENSADIYEMEGDLINRVKTYENDMATEEKEFVRVYSPAGKLAATHGTGGNVIERRKDKALKIFFDNVVNKVKQEFFYGSAPEYFIIFYSSSYSGIVNSYMNESHVSDENTTTITIDKNIDNKEDILSISRKEIKKSYKSEKKDVFQLAQEEFPFYTEGWLEVTKAANKGKVSILFIKPTAKKEGYLEPEIEEVYTYPRKDSIQIPNVSPWVVRQVLNNGGKLIILRGKRHNNSPDVAAKLRYRKQRQETNNREDIQKWVEERGGVPAIVGGTKDLLRIKFQDNEDNLEEISWTEFFNLLESNNLLFVYDEEEDSRFCTFTNKV